MVAIKLEKFGGMVPAIDDNYLPDNQAALSENAWVYTGALQGFNSLIPVYTCASSGTRRVFRIPMGFYDKSRIPNSYWVEFADPDTDVVRSPIANDSFERFYWANSLQEPLYSPKARLTSTSKSATVTISIGSPATFTLTDHSLVVGDPVYLTTTGALPTGLSANTDYFVSAVLSSSTFRVSATLTGAGITTSGTQSGTHTIYFNQPLKLGVPAPSSAPTVSMTGGTGTPESRAYIYTWVSEYGEEGPPSNPSAVTSGAPDGTWTVTVSNPTAGEAAKRKLKNINIYRAVTSSTGAATYFLVTTMAIGNTSYADSNPNVAANNQLQSLYWSPPPTDMKGMIAMPNGIIAGFRSNEVWFCEPYRPHAWPAPYAVSVDYPIVGLGVIGQTLIVCTTVSPYAISGVNPAYMAMSRIAAISPCTSRGSIVSTPAGVVYASPDGAALATPGSVTTITKELITKDKWQDSLPVTNLRSALLNDAYYCWGSYQGLVFQADTFQNDAFQGTDVTGGYSGAYIDFVNQRVAYNKLSATVPAVNAFNDVWTGEVFILKNGIVYWLDLSDSRPRDSYKWRSKIFGMPNRRNLEALRVWFKTFPDSPTPSATRNTNLVQTLQANQLGLVRVYADGNLVMCRELRTDGEFMRLPSGFKAAEYQIEVEARVRITLIETATSAKELINV